MNLHVEALYTHDTTGRIVRVNEHNGAPAPRFFLGITEDARVRRYRSDIDDATRHSLETASEHDTFIGAGPNAETEAGRGLSRYATILARSGPVEHTEAGPAFYFPGDLPKPGSSVVLITDANAGMLEPLMSAWVPDVRLSAPLFGYVVEGRAVAVCGSVRITPKASEAGVETAAAYRGRGYVGEVVAAWARAVRAAGAEPLYSTSWRNAASQAVARKLGLVQFGSDLHLT